MVTTTDIKDVKFKLITGLMEFKTLTQLIMVNPHVHSNITRDHVCSACVMKALRTLGICGMIVEDTLTINSHPNPSPLWSLLNTDYYVCVIYTFMGKQNKVQSVVTSAVWLSCKAV